METIIGRGGPSDIRSIPLATKLRTHIENEIPEVEPAPETVREMIAMFAQSHPLAKIRSVTSMYNCMGMVFAARRTYINMDRLGLILREDGYERVAHENDVQIGDVVVYGDADNPKHVGVVVAVDVQLEGSDNRIRRLTVMSKWGEHPEYFHPLDQVPERYGRPIAFWTDRISRQ